MVYSSLEWMGRSTIFVREASETYTCMSTSCPFCSLTLLGKNGLVCSVDSPTIVFRCREGSKTRVLGYVILNSVR